MRGSRPRQSLDISDLDFDLSLDLNLGGQIFKRAITHSFSMKDSEICYASRPRQSLDRSDLNFDLSLDLNLGGHIFK